MSAIAILVMLVLNIHQLNGASVIDHGGSLNQRQRREISNAADAQAALDAHNRLRRQEALTTVPGVANMEAVVWNNDLAILADNWASKCQWSHDPSISSMSPPVGQNLYAISGASLNVTKAIEDWYNEKKYYNYDTMQCQTGPNIMCGHYTQVVWATSYQIGCAAVFCSVLNNNGMTNAYLYACDYKPAGNYENTKIYTKGPVCTKCASGKMWCSNGLCNSSCTAAGPSCSCQTNSCNNQGTFNPTSCTCSCNPGWIGTDCSCQASSCSSHGIQNTATCTCVCYSGWSGFDCSTPNNSPRNRATNAVLVFVLGVNVFVVHNDLL